MNPFIEAAVTIALAVIGLATVSVIISRNANTSGVISASANGLAKTIGAATAPVSGGTNFGGLVPQLSLNLSSGGFGS